MRVLILGATGRVGGLALAEALAADHAVVALVRDPGALNAQPGLTVLGGSIADTSSVGAAMRGVDAVIAALGPRGNTIEHERGLEAGMRTLVAAMEDAGVRRLVALSGAGIDVLGDRKPWPDRVASRVVRRVARHVVGAKQREFDLFSAADIDWTALRPPLVTDGPPQGYRLDLRLRPGVRVRRTDVATALVDQLTDRRFHRAAPFVLPPNRR